MNKCMNCGVRLLSNNVQMRTYGYLKEALQCIKCKEEKEKED